MDTSSWLLVAAMVTSVLSVVASLNNVKVHRPGLGRLSALLGVVTFLLLAAFVVLDLASGYQIVPVS